MQFLTVEDQQKLTRLPLLNHKLAAREHSESYETTDTQNCSEIEQSAKGCEKLKGMSLMLLSVLFIDLTRFTVKIAYDQDSALSPIQQGCGKFTATLLLTVFAGLTSFKCQRVLCSIPRHMVCRFITRCFLFTAVSLFQAFGIKMLTYSTSVILSFTAPLVAPFTAFLLLREKITFCNILSLIISFAGVLIFTNPQFFEDVQTRPEGQENSILGIILMLASAVSRAFDISYMKLLNKAQFVTSKFSRFSRKRFIVSVQENGDIQCTPLAYEVNSNQLDQLTVLFYLSFIGSLVSYICFGVQQTIEPAQTLGLASLSTWALLTASGVLLIMSQLMYSLATKYQDVGKLASIFYIQIVMAFIWEAFVFHGRIGIAEILGTVIIVVTSVSVAVVKMMK